MRRQDCETRPTKLATGDSSRRHFLKMATLTAAAASSLHYAVADNVPATTAKPGGISLNYDDSSFFSWHPLDEMNAAGVDAWVDQFAGTQVDQLLFCLSSQRSDVASQVRQTAWDGYDPDKGLDQPLLAAVPDREFPGWPGGPNERQHIRNWIHAVWLLNHEGIDPYARWLARCRKDGIKPWLSLRMNDVHFVDNPDHPIHSRFWKEHPEYRRDPQDKYNGQALDYGRPEVRAYNLAYIREMVMRYDLDGFELDWMRNPFHFKPGREEEGLSILTEFTSDVRDLLKQRERELGHPIQLSARVPVQPETTRALGFDVDAWVSRKLIDRLVVMPFLFTQFDMPIERWKQLLKGHDVVLEAGLMISVVPYAGGLALSHSLETARGAAISFLDRGADRIYLFNFFDAEPYGVTGEAYLNSAAGKAFHRVMQQLGSVTTMAGKSRRHVVSNDDTWAHGQTAVSILPRDIGPGAKVQFKIPTGPRPTNEQVAQVRLAVGPFETGNIRKWKVLVNGHDCRPLEFIPFPLPSRPSLAFKVPSEAMLVRGFNDVEIHNPSNTTSKLVWVELAFSASHSEWPTSAIEVQQLDPEGC
jgi:hypothetical protein